jgi:hypothetical protein
MSRAHHRGVTGARWSRGSRIGLPPLGDGVWWGRHRRARLPSPVILQVTPPRLERVPLRAGRGEAHQAPVRGAGPPPGASAPHRGPGGSAAGVVVSGGRRGHVVTAVCGWPSPRS